MRPDTFLHISDGEWRWPTVAGAQIGHVQEGQVMRFGQTFHKNIVIYIQTQRS